MIIRINPSQPPSLEEAENFRAFKVVCTSPRGDCRNGFIEIGRLDGDHLWVDADWLRRRGPDNEQWTAGLGKMIDYAASAGWVDADGAIRAHIEDL